MPPGVRTPRTREEIDDALIEASPEESEELMRERRQSERYHASNDLDTQNDVFQALGLPLEAANVPMSARVVASTSNRMRREGMAADDTARAVDELADAERKLQLKEAEDAATRTLAGAERNAQSAALRSASVRSQIPDDLQGIRGEAPGLALPSEDTAPMAHAQPKDPAASGGHRRVEIDQPLEPSSPYGRGFGEVEVPRESAGITPAFDRFPQPKPGAHGVAIPDQGYRTPAVFGADEARSNAEQLREMGVDAHPFELQELDAAGTEVLARAPKQAPLPATAPTPSRLASLKKEWAGALENEYETVRDLVRSSQAYQSATKAAEGITPTLEGLRGQVVPRARAGVDVAANLAKKVGRPLTNAAALADPLAAAAIPLVAIGERMSKYGDLGENVRNLAYLNQAPIERMSAEGEANLKENPELIGQLWYEGALSDALAKRLLDEAGYELDESPPEEPVMLAQGKD